MPLPACKLPASSAVVLPASRRPASLSLVSALQTSFRRFDRGTLYCSPPTARLVGQQLRVKQSCIRWVKPLGDSQHARRCPWDSLPRGCGSPARSCHSPWNNGTFPAAPSFSACMMASRFASATRAHPHWTLGHASACLPPTSAFTPNPTPPPAAARCRSTRPSWWRGCASPSWTPTTARGQ